MSSILLEPIQYTSGTQQTQPTVSQGCVGVLSTVTKLEMTFHSMAISSLKTSLGLEVNENIKVTEGITICLLYTQTIYLSNFTREVVFILYEQVKIQCL